MKIYISDHLGNHKTTIQMEKWFKEHGHDVEWDMYYEPKKAEWCDVMIFEWLEGMLELCLKAGWGKKKPVYARAMDIEIWANNAVPVVRSGRDAPLVNARSLSCGR